MRFWGLFLREELYQAGRVRAIGLCSFYPHVPADFCETVETRPMVNQLELHSFFQQENALAVMKGYGVVVGQTQGNVSLMQRIERRQGEPELPQGQAEKMLPW